MYDVVFLILNYNSHSELIECVNSIRKYCQNYHIVVVDNGSDPTELKELKKAYSGVSDIYLILNNENMGFARGNNIGFRYIRKNIDCKYIAMINSDTLLTSGTFCRQLDEAYEKYRFAVLGPDVLPAKSNPMINEPDTKEKVQHAILKTSQLIKVMNTPFVNYAYLVLNRIHNKVRRKKILSEDIDIIGCELHGCFWVFSNLYILDGLCDDTFLYGEEDILAKDCRDHGLTMVYYPKIKIIHNESRATKRSIPNLIQRKKFFLENSLNSYKVLLAKYDTKEM